MFISTLNLTHFSVITNGLGFVMRQSNIKITEDLLQFIHTLFKLNAETSFVDHSSYVGGGVKEEFDTFRSVKAMVSGYFVEFFNLFSK